MKKRLQILPIISVALGGLMLSGTASAQSAPSDADRDYQETLLNRAVTTKDGAYELSTLLAQCHGFQSELYNHFTRRVEVQVAELDLYETLSGQSLRAGLVSYMLIFDHQVRPDKYVNGISNTTRAEWKPKFTKMKGRIDPVTWTELGKCSRIAPIAEFLISLYDAETEE